MEEAIAGTIVEITNSPEFREKLRPSILEDLSGKMDDITEQIFDRDDGAWENTYLAIRDNLEKIVPKWIAEELQKTESPIRKQIIDSISNHVENVFGNA